MCFWKKKAKGIMILEATMTLPVFLIITVCIIFNMRLYTLQGYIHTALSVSSQTANKAIQVINALDMESVGGQIPTQNQKKMFEEILCGNNGVGAYTEHAKDIYSQIGEISADGVEVIARYVFEKEMHRLIDDYLAASMPDAVMSPDDISISSFEITDTSMGRKLEVNVFYRFHYPFSIIGDVEKTMHICTYLE